MKGRKSAVSLSLSAPRWDMLTVVLFSVFLFLVMNIWMESASVWFAFIALVCCIGRTPWRLGRERFCIPVLGFLVFMVAYGLAAVYSPFNSAREFSWMLASFAVAALVLFRFEKRHVRGLLWGLAAVCAVISLISTDMACEGPLYEGFLSLMDVFNARDVYSDVANTTGRVNGIYNDANVTGSLFALGTLVSLYLVQTGKKWWERLLACVLVSCSALGILLSVSRGAILCFGLALLVWLVVVGKGQRLRLFLLMVVSAGVCLGVFACISAMVRKGALLPNFLVVAGGIAVYFLDWAINARIADVLDGHSKAIIAVAMGIVISGVVFVIIGLNLTEPYEFKNTGSLYRAVTLAPGEYTLEVDWEDDGEHLIQIYSRSEEQVLTYDSTELYRCYARAQNISFSVPDDSVCVYFQIWGQPGNILHSAKLSDGTEIPLASRLLPETIIRRLQGNLLQDNSFMLRLQYMKDAEKLFLQSPLIGHGLGSTDNLYPTVQPFYYASRYVHSHILQIMSDQGLLGTIPFLVFLGGVLWLLIRQLRKSIDPLAAMLVACWVMINSHSLIEINFSLQSYQCIAFILLLLPVVLYGEAITEKAVKAGGMAIWGMFWLYLAVFGGLLGSRQRVQQEYSTLRATSMEQLMSSFGSYAHRDVFYPAFYKLQYMATAVQDTQGLYGGQMMQYEREIRESGDYPSCSALLEYYYLPMEDFKSLFECSRECMLMRKSYANIWNGEVAFYQYMVLPAIGERNIDVFVDGVLAFQSLLDEVNADGRIQEIKLTEENQAFIALVEGAAERGLSGQELYDYLMTGGAG